MILTILNYYDVVLQHNTCSIKCFEVNLKLQRNLFRKHDYLAYMANINGSLPVIMNLSFFMSVLLTCHLLVFLLVAIYSEFLKHLAWYYITYGTDLAWECTNLIYERIANHSTVLKPSKIVGGGTGNISTEDLQPFINKQSYDW